MTALRAEIQTGFVAHAGAILALTEQGYQQQLVPDGAVVQRRAAPGGIGRLLSRQGIGPRLSAELHRRGDLAQLLLQHPAAIGAGKRSSQGLGGRGIAITAQLERDVQANCQLHQIVELAGIRRPMGEEEARQLQGRKVATKGLLSWAQQLPKPMQGLIHRPGRQPSLPALIRQTRGQLRQGLQRRHRQIQFQATGGQPLLAQQLHQRLKLLEQGQVFLQALEGSRGGAGFGLAGQQSCQAFAVEHPIDLHLRAAEAEVLQRAIGAEIQGHREGILAFSCRQGRRLVECSWQQRNPAAAKAEGFAVLTQPTLQG